MSTFIETAKTALEGVPRVTMTLPLESVSHNRDHELACLG